MELRKLSDCVCVFGLRLDLLPINVEITSSVTSARTIHVFNYRITFCNDHVLAFFSSILDVSTSTLSGGFLALLSSTAKPFASNNIASQIKWHASTIWSLTSCFCCFLMLQIRRFYGDLFEHLHVYTASSAITVMLFYQLSLLERSATAS